MKDNAMTIVRRRGESDFNRLRSSMLEQVQALASDTWTDYNLHDPGITILEQLCYALTDINQRSTLSADTYLADSEGGFAINQHGMFNPQQALSCRPANPSDLSKYMLDRFPELSHITIAPSELGTQDGERKINVHWLYHIKLTLKHPLSDDVAKEALKDKVREAYHNVRNLGEDLYTISYVRENDCELSATIYIDSDVSGIEVLSQVFYKAQAYLLGEVEASMQAPSAGQGGDNRAYLDGPVMRRAYISDEALRRAQEPKTINGLLKVLKDLSGVDDIDGLGLGLIGENGEQDIDNPTVDARDILASGNHCLRISIPASLSERKLVLVQNSRALECDLDELLHRLDALLQQEDQRAKTMSVEKQSERVNVDFKHLCDYTQLHTQFPNIYGINRYGVPASSDELRRAQARQLRGYLALFDQLMADHLAMAAEIKSLFSSAIDYRSSYPSQALGGASGDQMRDLYRSVPHESSFDNEESQALHWQRKERIFDYLIALNGRDKQDYPLGQGESYLSPGEKQRRTLGIKKNQLDHIHELAEHRAAAFDYSKPSWGKNNISTLERRLLMMLGLKETRRSLVYPLVKYGLEHREERLGFYFNATSDKVSRSLATLFYMDIDQSDIADKSHDFAAIPAVKVDQKEALKTFDYIKQRAFSKLKNLHEMLFSFGCNIDNYKTAHIHEQSSTELFVRISSGATEADRDTWLYLASFQKTEDAVLAGNHMCVSIKQVNLAMEGIHLIEHCLLLPLDAKRRTRLEQVSDISFYQNQISVVLPSWSARMQEAGVKHSIEKMLMSECPAHLLLHILWLNYSDMERFEVLFKNWCDAKSKFLDVDRLNKISLRLLRFLSSKMQDENSDFLQTPQ